MIEASALIDMLESSFDGIWITDGEGKILFANAANAKFIGVSRETLLGRTTQELLEKKIFSESAILEVLQTKKQVSKVSYNYRTDLTVLATATPVLDEAGEVRYVFNNVRDITALNQMQDSLRSKDEIIRHQNEQLESMKRRLGEGSIIGNSKVFCDVVELARRVASFDGSTVLILGESGTGKELVAQLVVDSSPRRDKPYLQVNCGAIPENLIESELFGYEKGAFTGADSKGRKGLFEAANGGTVFLDEIGDLALPMQVKLLRVLQQRQVTRVGGTAPVDLDVRVIAATHRDLKVMVHTGEFREDLYYRLNVVSIRLPPLRERREDILPLVNHFLQIINQKYNTKKVLLPNAIEAFRRYSWPGNVRELENLVENLVIATPSEGIRLSDLPESLRRETLMGESAVPTGPSVAPMAVLPLRETVERVEAAVIRQALDQCGSVRKAAAALQVDPSTLVRKMKKYRAEEPETP